MARESRVRTAVQFGGFVSAARPGERTVYHTGFLLDDRVAADQTTPRRVERALTLDALAEHVGFAADAGLVRLVQRVRSGARDYLAIRTRRKGRMW